MSNYTILENIKKAILTLNLVIVLFYSSLMLYSTHFVVDQGLAREYLAQIQYAPGPCWIQFWMANLTYWVLMACLLFMDPSRYWRSCLAVYLVLAIFCSILLNLSYNGLILVVFCFIMPSSRKYMNPWLLIGGGMLVYSLFQYEMAGSLFHLSDPLFYIEVLPRTAQKLIYFLKTLFESLNLVCFITYFGTYLFSQFQQNENIEKELEMVTAVNTQLRDYAAITEKIGEDRERKRLAREIHDTLGHALTGIAAGIDACLVLIEVKPEAAKKQLQIVSQVVRQGIQDVRNSLNKLRPGALDEKGFKGALEKMIQEFMDVSSLKIRLDYRLDSFDFDVTKEDIYYRIMQESITNALRHGKATEVDLAMYQQDHSIVLEIQDNGTGCTQIRPGFGLKQMQERVMILGGSLALNGENGFYIKIVVPIQKGENNDSVSNR